MKEQFELYENARKRIKQKKWLYVHFVLFVVGAVALIVLDKLLEIPFYGIIDWSYWTISIWFALWVFHFINVFITKKFMGKDWEQKQVEKLVAKQEKRIEEIKKGFERDAQFKAESEFYNQQEKKNTKQTVTIIAAVANDNALGKDNDLIWHLPADLKRFKKTTSGHHIIMGRKTFESIGKPLPNRTTVIITRNSDFKAEGCEVVDSLEKALEVAKNDDTPFIIGGAQIYAQAITIADKLDITEVHHSFDADVYFPEIDKNTWKETSRENISANEDNTYDYSFVSYSKK